MEGAGQDDAPAQPDAVERAEAPASFGASRISRRRFATVIGAGSIVVAGGAWSAPKITSVRHFAQVGSPPPGSSTTSSTVVQVGEGSVVVTPQTACPGTEMTIVCSGFAPGTAVALKLGTGRVLGIATFDGNGELHTVVKLPASVSAGNHTLLAIGVSKSGADLTASTPLTVPDAATCAAPTTTVPPVTTPPTSPPVTDPGVTTAGSTSPATVPLTTPPATTKPPGPRQNTNSGDGVLAFTGADTADLAVLGATAAIVGRALYGIARSDRDEEDEEPERGQED